MKIFIKNAPMRILIARESAPCQLLCSLIFEMGGKKEEKKIKSRLGGGHQSWNALLHEARFPSSFGKDTEMRTQLLGHTEVLNQKHMCIKGLD